MRRRAIVVVLALLGFGAAAAEDMAAHVGSFRSRAEADAAWGRLKAQHRDILGSREAALVEAEVGDKGRWVRILLPAANRAEANQLCAALKAKGAYCAPMVGALAGARPASAPAARTAVTPPAPATPAAPSPAAPSPPPGRPSGDPLLGSQPAPMIAAPSGPAMAATVPRAAPERAEATPFFGQWVRKQADCGKRSMTLGPGRLAIREPESMTEMACKSEVKGTDLQVSCEDESRALFEIIDQTEMILRWTQANPTAKPANLDQVWRRCAERRR